MAKLREADFYYGATLSHLINQKLCPTLIDGGKDRRIYEFTTDEGDFVLYEKYRSTPLTENEKYRSWSFKFSDGEIQELRGYIKGEKALSLCLVLGCDKSNDSEISFLHKEDIQEILFSKKSITIKRYSKGKYYHICGTEIKIKNNREY